MDPKVYMPLLERYTQLARIFFVNVNSLVDVCTYVCMWIIWKKNQIYFIQSFLLFSFEKISAGSEMNESCPYYCLMFVSVNLHLKDLKKSIDWGMKILGTK